MVLENTQFMQQVRQSVSPFIRKPFLNRQDSRLVSVQIILHLFQQVKKSYFRSFNCYGCRDWKHLYGRCWRNRPLLGWTASPGRNLGLKWNRRDDRLKAVNGDGFAAVSDLQDEELLLPPEHEVGAAVERLQRWYMSISADKQMQRPKDQRCPWSPIRTLFVLLCIVLGKPQK